MERRDRAVAAGRTGRGRAEAAAEIGSLASAEALNFDEQRTTFGPPNDSLAPIVNMTLTAMVHTLCLVRNGCGSGLQSQLLCNQQLQLLVGSCFHIFQQASCEDAAKAEC